jgi:hypothetical protein
VLVGGSLHFNTVMVSVRRKLQSCMGVSGSVEERLRDTYVRVVYAVGQVST